MKKSILTLILALSTLLGFSQLSTKAPQDTANARLSLIKTATYSNSVTLTAIKKSNDTINQNLRSEKALIYLQRPSEKTGRAHKSGILVSQTVTATSYTVTAAKTLYITSITLSAINSSTSTVGSIIIQDNSTEKIPLLIPASATTGANATAFIQMTFLEPRQFSTNVNATIVAGNINYSMSWTGYEE